MNVCVCVCVGAEGFENVKTWIVSMVSFKVILLVNPNKHSDESI